MNHRNATANRRGQLAAVEIGVMEADAAVGRRLQTGKEAIERANDELESRLAEIFFTHEFFKALTSYSSVDDVSSLIVDGANGILWRDDGQIWSYGNSRKVYGVRAEVRVTVTVQDEPKQTQPKQPRAEQLALVGGAA